MIPYAPDPVNFEKAPHRRIRVKKAAITYLYFFLPERSELPRGHTFVNDDVCRRKPENPFT